MDTCGDKNDYCSCELETGHDGHCKCECSASWEYDDLGRRIVTAPSDPYYTDWLSNMMLGDLTKVLR